MASAEKHTLGGSDQGDLQVSLQLLSGLTASPLLGSLSTKNLKEEVRQCLRFRWHSPRFGG